MKENIEFNPDAELVSFAKWFSENYLTLDAGDYFSENKKYQIKWISSSWESNGVASWQGALCRIETYTGIMELDKKNFSSTEYNSDFIFYIPLFLTAISLNPDDAEVNMSAFDVATLKYYATTGRSLENVFFGMLALFKSSNDNIEDNLNRCKEMASFIDRQQYRQAKS